MGFFWWRNSYANEQKNAGLSVKAETLSVLVPFQSKREGNVCWRLATGE